MKNNNLLYIKIHPIITFIFFLVGSYLAFFANIEWVDSIMRHPFVQFFTVFIVSIFQIIVAIIFFTNVIITFNGIFSHKKLLSRMWFHFAISVVIMLLLSFMVLLILVFFVPKTYQETLLVEEIAEQSVMYETFLEEESISEILDIESNYASFDTIFMNNNMVLKEIYENNNRSYMPLLLFIFLCIVSVLFLLLGTVTLFMRNPQHEHANRNIKVILDAFMHNVQFIAISAFRAVEIMLQWIPLWIVLFLPYMIKELINKNIAYALMQYVYIYYMIGLFLIIINFILIIIKTKCSIKTALHVLAYPMFISLSSGSSIVAMYSSVQNTALYMKGNLIGIKSFMPLYFFFARMGNVIYFVFIVFVLSHIFSFPLFPMDFIVLSCIATLFSFVPTTDQSMLLLPLLGIYFLLFGIPLQPAMIIVFGFDILFKPMRSALTTNFAITIVSLFERKHEKYYP